MIELYSRLGQTHDDPAWQHRVERLARKMVEWKGHDPDLEGHYLIPFQVPTPEGMFTAHTDCIKLWQCYEHLAACVLREIDDETNT